MRYKANDNKQQKKEDRTMDTGVDVMKEQYATGLATMHAHLEMFEDLSKSFQQDKGDMPEEALIAANMAVVLDMAQKYHDVARLNYSKMYGEEWKYDGRFDSVDRENAGAEGAAGASVPEAGAERGADTGGERHEPDGLGGGDGQGAVNGGGDRDGHDTDTRE